MLIIAFLFFFNDTATTEIYTLSLHDALPISTPTCRAGRASCRGRRPPAPGRAAGSECLRSEEHTSELQSRPHLVCRLLLEKKKRTVGQAGGCKHLANYRVRHCTDRSVRRARN